MKRKKTISYKVGGTLGGHAMTITLAGNYAPGFGRDHGADHMERIASTIIRAISDGGSIPITLFKTK